MTRVLLAEDHALMRDGLRRLLESAGFDVVAEAGDGDEVVAVATAARPDVVVMDVSLPRRDGIAAARELTSRAPSVGVVFLSMFDDEETIAACARAGGRAYLVKDCSVVALTDALRAVAARGDLLSRYREPARALATRTPGLSARELEVLRLAATGASSAEIATSLYVSQKTVKNHLASIYDKLGVHDRTQAVLTGIRSGLVALHSRAQRPSEHRDDGEMGRVTY